MSRSFDGRRARREAYLDAGTIGVMNHSAILILVTTRPPLPVAALLLTITGLGFGMGATTILHHGGHARFSSNVYVNALVVHLAVPVGLWVWFWGAKHRIHHRLPATYPEDTYTSATMIVRLHPDAPSRWYHAYQPYYILVLYCLYGIFDLLSQVRFAVSGQIRYSEWSAARGVRIRSFAAEKVMVVAILAPYFVLNPSRLAISLASSFVVAGAFSAVMVGVGHINRGLNLGSTTASGDWKVDIIESTVSFSPESRVAGWFTGGLNLHTAHHLRPLASRHELRASHKELRITHPSDLRECVSLGAAVRGHFGALRDWGAAVEPGATISPPA